MQKCISKVSFYGFYGMPGFRKSIQLSSSGQCNTACDIVHWKLRIALHMYRTDFAVPLQQIDKMILTAFLRCWATFQYSVKAVLWIFVKFNSSLGNICKRGVIIVKKAAVLRYVIYWYKAHNTYMQC